MSINDLVFKTNLSSDGLFSPLQVNDPVTVSITNYGDTNLTDLGFYLVPSTDLGSIDQPASFPPETDYQDLIEWGTATELGLTAFGGLKITAVYDGSDRTTYFSRTAGAKSSNKIEIDNISSGETVEVTLELETPTGVTARRLYVSLKVA